jgi:hypothetical protein
MKHRIPYFIIQSLVLSSCAAPVASVAPTTTAPVNPTATISPTDTSEPTPMVESTATADPFAGVNYETTIDLGQELFDGYVAAVDENGKILQLRDGNNTLIEPNEAGFYVFDDTLFAWNSQEGKLVEAYSLQKGALALWDLKNGEYETLFAAETYVTDKATGWITGFDKFGKPSGVYDSQTGKTYSVENALVKLDGKTLAWDGVTWKEVVTPAELVVMDEEAQTVSWWNKNTKSYEVLENIKPGEVKTQTVETAQGPVELVTGVVTSIPNPESAETEVTAPVAVVDLTNGKLARGDFLNTVENQILFNSAVKVGGEWHVWQEKDQTWQPVTDELTINFLELGLDPTRTYKEEDWNNGQDTYLVNQYNKAREARKTETGWEKIEDLKQKYPSEMFKVPGNPYHDFTLRDEDGATEISPERGVFADHFEPLWYCKELGQFMRLYGVKLIVNQGSEIAVIHSTNQERFTNFWLQVKTAGGYGSGWNGECTAANSYTTIKPSRVLEANIYQTYENSSSKFNLVAEEALFQFLKARSFRGVGDQRLYLAMSIIIPAGY